MISPRLSDTSSLDSSKNLLAFSAGVDSSALFFLLIENRIPFDIALVNYGLREESLAEEEYAIALAKEYNLAVYIAKAPQWTNNFEANARAFRYEFFHSLIDTHNYTHLLTAHQLNDQLEWFLMRLTKGAGVSELIGLQPSSLRQTPKENPFYLLRPLLQSSKAELLAYLKYHTHHYFVDKSNSEDKYERNRFRANWSDMLIENYADGITRSFAYLREEKLLLEQGIETIISIKELRVLHLTSSRLRSKGADIALKELGYLLSSKQREEIAEKKSIVIGGKWAVVYQNSRLYIAPFINTPMPKIFKELCRVSAMPIKIRSYCYQNDIRPRDVMIIDKVST